MTVVRRKVAAARKAVMSLMRASQVAAETEGACGTQPGAWAASAGNASRNSLRNRDRPQEAGLIFQQPVRIEQQQSHVFLRRVVERIEAAGRGMGLAGEAEQQQAVVESRADHAGRVASDAVQRVESTRGQQHAPGRQLELQSWRADDGFAFAAPDVRQRGQRIDQRVAGEQRCGAQLRKKIGAGPPARDEISLRIGVVPPLAADGEVQQRAGLRRRFTQVTGAAGGASGRGEDAAVLRANSDHARRVVKQLLAEVALGLTDLEERVRAAIGQAWLRQRRIVGRNL